VAADEQKADQRDEDREEDADLEGDEAAERVQLARVAAHRADRGVVDDRGAEGHPIRPRRIEVVEARRGQQRGRHKRHDADRDHDPVAAQVEPDELRRTGERAHSDSWARSP
jgi:hypothetical protein